MNIKLYPAKRNELVKFEQIRSWQTKSPNIDMTEFTPVEEYFMEYRIRIARIPEEIMNELGADFDARNLVPIIEKRYLEIPPLTKEDPHIVPYETFGMRVRMTELKDVLLIEEMFKKIADGEPEGTIPKTLEV